MRVLAPLLGGTSSKTLQLVNMKSPQQQNAFDCGIYTLAIAERLCLEPMRGLDDLTPAVISAKREEWHELLGRAVAEGGHGCAGNRL